MSQKPRDTQCKAVYDWENEFRNDRGEMTLAQCRALVKRVWRDHYGRHAKVADRHGRLEMHIPPRVTDGRARRVACYQQASTPGNDAIKLPRWARNDVVVLHEIAHGLLIRETGDKYSWHGPEFVRVFLELIADYTDVNVIEMRRAATSQRPRKVRIANHHPLTTAAAAARR